MPILAEKTIGCATGIKNCQIVTARIFASLAYPFRYTVRRQWISIPVQQTALRRSSEVSKPAILSHAQTTKTPLPIGNLALIAAQDATGALCSMRGIGWQPELLPRLSVDPIHIWQCIIESLLQAVSADPQSATHQSSALESVTLVRGMFCRRGSLTDRAKSGLSFFHRIRSPVAPSFLLTSNQR